MLRGESIICGTSTTGTGALTLAATPVAPGGIDFDVLARATGVGFANSAAVLVSYVIIEYTDTTFGTAKSQEKGIGTLTLGGSAGIANCTLARTTVQVTATSLNSQPATYNTNAPTAVSIATAANTLVFIGAAAADLPAYVPYFESGVGDAIGVSPTWQALGSTANGSTLTSGTDVYQLFEWRTSMLVKRATIRVGVTNSGTSNVYGRIYAINTSGRPGKLLLDLGVFGTSNLSLSNPGNVSTALHSTGYFLTPGEYFFDMLPIYSGGVGSPALLKYTNNAVPTGMRTGMATFVPYIAMTATSGNSTAPDPANVTGYAGQTSSSLGYCFTLNSA